MNTSYRPANKDQVLDILRTAAEQKQTLEIKGRGTKQGYGHPLSCSAVLDLSDLVGIDLYEPEELIMRVRPGTPVAEIRQALEERGQMLAFEPPDLGPLYGKAADHGSIGGAFLCNLSGPRRFKAGAARDHLLGFTAVSGRAEYFKSGGRVMKNVTGYDLSKLICGSFGTLAAVTELTFKVLPRAEMTEVLLLTGLDLPAALQAMSRAVGSSLDPSGIAYLPAAVARRSALRALNSLETSAAVLRIEGPAVSVSARMEELKRLFQGVGQVRLYDEEATLLWREIADVHYFLDNAEAILWRISVPPMMAAQVMDGLDGLGGLAFFDWAGGLIWLQLQGPDAAAQRIRQVVNTVGGHATLLRAPDAIRASQDIFHPEPPVLARVTGDIRQAFDPMRLLNPGRMRRQQG